MPSRYTFVWGKSIHTRISRIAEQLEERYGSTPSPSPKQELLIPHPSHIRISLGESGKALCQIDDALNGVDADRKMEVMARTAQEI